MAIYSFSTKPMSRSSGRSAVAAAAYRSGTELVDERTGLAADYTRRRGVVHTEILAAQGITPPDREQLWNAAEAAEKRRDARVAREFVVALPHELDSEQRLSLARELAEELVERYGVAVDLAVHAPDQDGDQRNHHAHLLATTRRLNHDGLGDKAAIEWSDKKRRDAGLGRGSDEVKRLRERWEALANAALERAQTAERIDCRSLAEQGVGRVPQIHVGPMGTEQARRGTPENSARATLNLEILAANQELHQLQIRAARRSIERAAQADDDGDQELDAAVAVLTLTERAQELEQQRRPARQHADQVRGELLDAQRELTGISGLRGWLLQRGKRRAAQARVDALGQRLEVAQEEVSRIDGELRATTRALEEARQHSGSVAVEQRQDRPHEPQQPAQVPPGPGRAPGWNGPG